MQKKLIALAVAALASGAAFAQTNVQIYGSIDMGFSHRGDSSLVGGQSENNIDSGISAGNRLGFKGTEDLGNGLKALFNLEMGFAAEADVNRNGTLAGRQAFVGLTGGFGTAIAGRLYTPHYSFLSALDPFKAGTVGSYRNVYGAGATLTTGPAATVATGGLTAQLDPTRVDNAVAYVSPSFSGFNVTLAYSNNAIGDEVNNAQPTTPGFAQGNPANSRVVAVLPRYTNGPLDIGVSFHQINVAGSGNIGAIAGIQPHDVRNWVLGGSYDFNVVKLSGFYSDIKVENNGVNTDDFNLKNWMLGAAVPFGKHAVQVSYNRSKLEVNNGFDDAATSQWALGYTYSLSKRTNVYAAYADISNDDSDGVNGVARNAVVGDNSNSGTTYQNGFNVGLRHQF